MVDRIYSGHIVDRLFKDDKALKSDISSNLTRLILKCHDSLADPNMFSCDSVVLYPRYRQNFSATKFFSHLPCMINRDE